LHHFAGFFLGAVLAGVVVDGGGDCFGGGGGDLFFEFGDVIVYFFDFGDILKLVIRSDRTSQIRNSFADAFKC